MYSSDVYDLAHTHGGDLSMLRSSDADNDITISVRISLSEAVVESARLHHLPPTDRTRVESDTVPEMLISYISTLG